MQVTNVQEILAGMQDNVDDATMDSDLEFFEKTAKELHVKDYDKLGVIIDDDFEFDAERAENQCVTEEKNGIQFVYFENEEIAQAECDRASVELEGEDMDYE